MRQWVTSAGFALGVFFAATLSLSWVAMSVALAVGCVLLFLDVRRKGNLWMSLVWNVVLAGAMWCTLRQGMHERWGEDGTPSMVERLSRKASSVSRESLMACGMSEEHVSVLNAMLAGDRKSLSAEQKYRFRGAGVQHLLALSGLHLGIFLALFSFLWLRRVRFTRWRWPVLWATMVLLWGYCFLAGMPQSLLRSVLMATLYYMALFRTEESHMGINLAHTMLLMLLIDPMCLFDVGTQLSFSAVAALTWLYPILDSMIPFSPFPADWRERWCKRVWRLFLVSLTAWLGTMPLCLFYFHQFQPWQPLVSVLLVPMTTLLLYLAVVLLLLGLCGLFLLSRPLAWLVGGYMDAENWILDVAGRLPGSTLFCPDIHWGHVVLFYLLLFLLGVGISSPRKVLLWTFPAVLLVFLVLLFV